MKCPYFKQVYDSGMCLASKISRVTSIDEMGSFCFMETYNLCAIINSHRSDKTVKGIGYTDAGVKHSAYDLTQRNQKEEHLASG